ncbi:MAG: hypothetical protein ACLPY5_16365 [Candidatus Bathyarchaeia archaeon]
MLESPQEDIVKEAERILDRADKQRLTLRLFGGLAIRFHCPSATHRSLERKYADIDFMGLSKQLSGVKSLFPELGYTPREIFNAISGGRRLIFNDVDHGRRVDIFMDIFQMCHKFEMKNRLALDKQTISLADLLATKLQVVRITEREYRDIIALIHDHEIGDSDAPEIINAGYLALLCGKDWGIYKTFSINITNILNALDQFDLDTKYQDVVRSRLVELKSIFEATSKSTIWKARAKIGERKQWYELPEEDREVVASQDFKIRGS